MRAARSAWRRIPSRRTFCATTAKTAFPSRGWEVPKERRKPQPYALFDIMEKLHFAPGEMLVLDDLKPGYDMARAANVPFAAALWSNDIPEIEAFMRGNCGLCFKTIAQFRDYLFSGKEA